MGKWAGNFANGFSVGYGRLAGWLYETSTTPRNLKTSNSTLPQCLNATAPWCET